MCIFHKYKTVIEVNHLLCGQCFADPAYIGKELRKKYPQGYCPHSFKVCVKCGKAVGYGSHGKLTCIPDTCKRQIIFMQNVRFCKR